MTKSRKNKNNKKIALQKKGQEKTNWNEKVEKRKNKNQEKNSKKNLNGEEYGKWKYIYKKKNSYLQGLILNISSALSEGIFSGGFLTTCIAIGCPTWSNSLYSIFNFL